MSLFRRMRDITVATLNEHLERSEDPVRLIDQYLAAQREQLQQSERLYQQCVSSCSVTPAAISDGARNQREARASSAAGSEGRRRTYGKDRASREAASRREKRAVS